MTHDPSNPSNAMLRELPSIGALLEVEPLAEPLRVYGQTAVASAARDVVEQLRSNLAGGHHEGPLPTLAEIADQVIARLAQRDSSAIRPVINATGILLHTGLGRAPLATEAVAAASAAAQGYCNVELDLDSGARTQRSRSVARLLSELTDAESAHVVNNNAGATGLAIAALAAGREVIVSHGELIEIGGGYRLPDVITAYGAKLRAVGTTNKTRTADYAAAINDQTGALVVVHPSNYHIAGFTAQPPLEELAMLAREHRVPLIHDIGSGALIDFAQFGCQREPIASESIRAGADLVLFSGDKLLGGPQCGIVVGRRDLVDRVVSHPLSRALRVDKITLAALHATLLLYRNDDTALRSIPLLRFLNTPLGELRHRAEYLAERLQKSLAGWDVDATHDEAFVGGGSLPQQSLASWSVILSSAQGQSVESLAANLRRGDPAIVGRVQQDRLILCLHGMFPEQDEPAAEAIERAAAK